MQVQKQRSQRRGSAEAEMLSLRLRANAARYFPDLDEADIRIACSRAHCRKMSAVFEFEVMDSRQRRTVIAKVNRERRDAARRANLEGRAALDRPRLAPWIPRDVSAQMEYDALRIIRLHFSQLDDHRFSTVRPLDLLPEGPVIVMEKLPLQNLKHLFVRHHRLRGASDEAALVRTFQNAGAWLRELHSLQPLAHTEPRRPKRGDFVQTVGAFADFLAETHGHSGFFRSMAAVVEERAADVLPEVLPRGVLHGDYGPRNVLADAAGTVAGFDTRARCYGPIYEDLGYFRAMLHKDSPQMYGAGFCYPPQWVERLGDEFLRGYFGNGAVPWEAIRLFEVEALLDKWAPYTLGYRESKGIRRVAKRCRLEMLSQFFLRRLHQLVGKIRSSATPSLTGACHVATTEIC